MTIRPATRDDVATLYRLVVALADYERLRHEVTGSPEMLADGLFGPGATAEALIAEIDGDAAGYAIFFHTFSTFACRRAIWLEDLFVPPEHRRAGVGRALLKRLAALAVERDCVSLDWAALTWNESALSFYDSLGARVMDDWRTLTLEGDALVALAM